MRKQDALEELTPENEALLKMFDFAIEDASDKTHIIDDMMGLMGDDTILGQLKREIAEETIDCVVDYLKLQKYEMELSMLDEQVAEQ